MCADVVVIKTKNKYGRKTLQKFQIFNKFQPHDLAKLFIPKFMIIMSSLSLLQTLEKSFESIDMFS